MVHQVRGITGRITFQLVAIVTITIMITAAIGYTKLYEVTETNASIRIDRAARAAVSIFTLKLRAMTESGVWVN